MDMVYCSVSIIFTQSHLINSFSYFNFKCLKNREKKLIFFTEVMNSKVMVRPWGSEISTTPSEDCAKYKVVYKQVQIEDTFV